MRSRFISDIDAALLVLGGKKPALTGWPSRLTPHWLSAEREER
jgi:hypothetical protein